MSVQRFDPSPLQMTPSSEGAYVRYEDYAKLEKALEQAIQRALLVSEDSQTESDIRVHGLEVCQRLIVWNSRPDFAELAAYLKKREQPQ